ncbi:hypothetical protein OO015_13770 (plasmid) [Thermomicrobium sp. 4228-Ro]|uniref:tail completion protein gp17 n=1 Tax=Thermomicrobium sp. 4228-Ro TaxID=2993937 RepID=UPI0022488CAC|nr:hypothetical protein [Thermomicrobium sp. 4228-Ro]MCX2728553.1 hypothetical protein [Thermomicrobium sp. 4228-Ro]
MIEVLRQHAGLTALVPAEQILARYAEPSDPPRLVTVTLAGGWTSDPLLVVSIDVRCWAETGREAMRIWQEVHHLLSDAMVWASRGVTSWRLQVAPRLLPDPDVALTQVITTYQAFVYPEEG